MTKAKRFLKVLLVLMAITLGMLYFFQEKLIFYSSTLPQDFEYPFQTEFEELFLTAEDGAILNGLHFKAKNPKGIILYNHGNTGEIDTWGQWGELLVNRYSYDVVIWDYRGYGKSTGKRRQELMLDDGLLFYSYCQSIFNEESITVYGRSLGGFFATHIAKQTQPKQLLLESTPTTLLEVAKQAYRFIPSKWLLKFRFQNTENIAQINEPTYIIHGTDDDLIPFEQGERLFELSKAKTKHFLPIEGGNHNDLASGFETSYFTALDKVFN
ncbi:alpha/beta hydrolase [bacterium]|nr:alpha/beta hydrolase [bacterium]